MNPITIFLLTLLNALLSSGNFIPNSDNGILADLGEPCAADSDCDTEHSYCDAEALVCTCLSDYLENQGKCLKLAEHLGDPCEIDEQCIQNLSDLSTCFSQGICICKPNGIPSSSRDRCLPILEKLGDVCLESVQCQQGAPGNFSQCAEDSGNPEVKACSCKDEAIPDNSNIKCLRKAVLVGDSCQVHQQCSSNLGNQSECYSSRCRCKAGSTANPERTKCVQGLNGKPCQEDAGCPTNGRCLPFGMCTCGSNNYPRSFVSSEKLDECLPVVAIGATCKEPQQCQQGTGGPMSLCGKNFNGNLVCMCHETSIAVADPNVGVKCFPKVQHVGHPCKYTEQCLPNLEYSQCLDEKCECFANAVPSKDGTKCILIENDEL